MFVDFAEIRSPLLPSNPVNRYHWTLKGFENLSAFWGFSCVILFHLSSVSERIHHRI